MDEGETPWECAVREGLEETGLRFADRPRLLAMHYLPPLGTWTTHKIGFVFDGGRLTAEQIAGIVLDPDEHTEVAVKSLEDWERELPVDTFQRLAAVAHARRDGAARYIEYPPSP
jgi:protein-L-isoaspartate(D-aspartate) O-methyltransferase